MRIVITYPVAASHCLRFVDIQVSGILNATSLTSESPDDPPPSIRAGSLAPGVPAQIRQVRESELLELKGDLEEREKQLQDMERKLLAAEQERRQMHNKIQVCGIANKPSSIFLASLCL